MKRPLEGNFTIISDKIMAAKRASRGLSTRTYESKGQQQQLIGYYLRSLLFQEIETTQRKKKLLIKR